MLLAIDVGNTQTVFGLWDGEHWRATWRRSTHWDDTEDQLAVWLRGMFELSGLPFVVSGAICGSVVPQTRQAMEFLASKWLGCSMTFLEKGADVGLNVDYQPPHAVGADRICNALGALEMGPGPIIVVDFGTATTFDAIDANGTYVGGAILTGIQTSTDALIGKTAKLPVFELKAPSRAIGKSTIESLQSGVVLGYAGAIDALAGQIDRELGGESTVIATGGLGSMFVDLCASIHRYEANLTLDGLRIAFERLSGHNKTGLA